MQKQKLSFPILYTILNTLRLIPIDFFSTYTHSTFINPAVASLSSLLFLPMVEYYTYSCDCHCTLNDFPPPPSWYRLICNIVNNCARVCHHVDIRKFLTRSFPVFHYYKESGCALLGILGALVGVIILVQYAS